MLGRIEDALADQAAVGARHARFFLVLAASDHQSCRDLQLAEHVALLVAFHGHAGIGLVFVERIGVQRLYLARRIDQAPGVGERSQTDARAGRSFTRCTVRPNRAAKSPNRPKLLPASTMNRRGR